MRNIGMNELDDMGAHPGAALYSHPGSDECNLAKNHHPLQRRSPAPLKKVKRVIRRILRKLGLKM